jgi:hypothetical protein
MPWKIGEFVLKNVNKFDDFAAHFSISNLRYDEHIKGFDPYDIFRQHLHSLGLDDCFVNKHLPKNRDSHGPASDADEVETVQSCTKLYTQQGKDPSDKSVQSTNTTPKSTTSSEHRSNAHHSNKETQNSSNGGGDNDPPHSKIDSSHKLPVEKKRKKNVGQAEDPEIQSENMEIDTDLDAMFPFFDQPEDAIHHSHPMDISVAQNFDEDESFVFQSVVFDSRNKKLIFQKKNVKNIKGKSCSEVDVANMRPSQICQLHTATGEALHDSIERMETHNARLKDRVKELEDAFFPMPLLVDPLAIAMPGTPAPNVKAPSTLLASCKGYVENNITKRMELVTDAWKRSQTIASLGTRAHSLLELLQAELKDEENFFLKMVIPFGKIVNNMTETKRREEDLPSKNRIGQLNACWKEKVNNLHLIVQSCEQVISKKDKLFTKLSNIDLAGKTNDFQDPLLIANSLPLTREEFDKQVAMLKTFSLEKFYNILQFDQSHVHDWLVKYAVQNEEIHQALSNLSIDFQELENDLFNIKIQNEINVAPMRAYIEEWVERQLKQAANERQQAVASIPAAVENILETAVVADINERAAASK